MNLLLFKSATAPFLTAICSIEKITNANSHQEINIGYKVLIDSGGHSKLKIAWLNPPSWRFTNKQHIVSV